MGCSPQNTQPKQGTGDRGQETGAKSRGGDQASGTGVGPACQGACLVPDVGVSGEHAVFEGLGGHPTHRQKALPSFPVIVSLVDVSRHAEICGAGGRQGS